MFSQQSIFIACFAMILALGGAVRAGAPSTQPAQFKEYTPPALQDIGVDEKGGSTIPLDLTFVDETGKAVKLGSYFHKGRPVILQLSYFGCPMLCTLVSQGMVDSLNDLTLTMGKDYEAINVSFDPKEGPDLATMKKRSFVQAYNRPAGAESWHFLTGKPDAIKKLTSAVGFRYKWLEDSHQFSHPAVLMVLSPEGKISRYLYGVKYDPRTLRLAMVEASHGKVGTTLDRIILTCCAFDPSTGKYTTTIMGLTRIVCALLVVVLGIGFLGLRRIERTIRLAREARDGQGRADLTTT
jgi:protein SCO1/2